jgi:hypothetical protein
MRSLSIKKGQQPLTEEKNNMAEALSAKEVARELNTDARTFRKFMRATLPKDKQPGQGNRYSIDPEDLDDLKKKFVKWGMPKSKAEKPPVVEEIDIDDDGDEDLLLDELGDEDDEDPDEEPSDEELEVIEASNDFDLEEL